MTEEEYNKRNMAFEIASKCPFSEEVLNTTRFYLPAKLYRCTNKKVYNATGNRLCNINYFKIKCK